MARYFFYNFYSNSAIHINKLQINIFFLIIIPCLFITVYTDKVVSCKTPIH